MDSVQDIVKVDDVVVISFEDAVANHHDEGIPREDITETTDLAVTVLFQRACSVGSGNSRSILVRRLLKEWYSRRFEGR